MDLIGDFGRHSSKIAFHFLCFSLPFFRLAGGVTAPPEINIFIPSPTDMSNGMTSSCGTRRRTTCGIRRCGHEDINNFLFNCRLRLFRSLRSHKTKHPAYTCGYSTNTTSRNTARLSFPKVSTICLTDR